MSVFDHNGESVTTLTSPFQFNGFSTVTFEGSEDLSLEGKYYWPSISANIYLLEPGTSIDDYDELEIELLLEAEFETKL